MAKPQKRCLLHPITLVMGAFVGAFTVSLLDSKPVTMADIEHERVYEVTVID